MQAEINESVQRLVAAGESQTYRYESLLRQLAPGLERSEAVIAAFKQCLQQVQSAASSGTQSKNKSTSVKSESAFGDCRP